MDSTEYAKVKSIQFGVLSPDEIKSMSVCEIEHEEAFEAGNKIREGGLLDLRLGPLDKKAKCQTCDSKMEECVGHFGHIEFDKPIYHVGLIKSMADILRCVCFHCSRLLINKHSSAYKRVIKTKNPVARMKTLLAECKSQADCNFYNKKGENEGCELEQPLIKIEENIKIQITFSKPFPEYSDKEVFWLNGELATQILKRIDRDDYYALACSENVVQPHWMNILVLPVPPNGIRPSNLSNAAARGEDDLTHKLSDIVRMRNNTRSKQRTKGSDVDVAKYQQMVQIYGAGYFDNNAVGHQQIMQRMGRPQKGLRQRLKGKEGRIRGSLMGKRVDFTARTVITPDPCMKSDEVGVPEKIARGVTYPEAVNRFNIDELRKRVEIGPDQKFGAEAIEYNDKNGKTRKVDLRMFPDIEKRKKIELVEGSVVHRYLRDGDRVVMNRQPSLHRYSTMGHKVKIMKFQTARLPLNVTKPYNADFDGDEMNMHVPQDIKTAAEVELLMGVPQNFLTPQSNKPVMGIVQDSLSACYVLSLKSTFLDRAQVMQIIGFLESWDGVLPRPCIIKPKELWSGKQVLGVVLGKLNLERFSKFRPENEDRTPNIEKLSRQDVLNLLAEKFQYVGDESWSDNDLKRKLNSLEKERFWMTPSDTRVYIKDGEIMSGIFCNKILGTAPGSLIQVFALDKGPSGIMKLVDDLQEIGRLFMLMFGLSIGVGDMREDSENKSSRAKYLNHAKAEIENIRREPGMSEKEFEARVNKVLNDVRRKISEDTLSRMPLLNSFAIPVRSGAKGEPSNPAQVVRTIGQNNVEGKRIPLSFEGRCLPHFTRGDYSPEARGYVNSNYMEGVNPHEYWFISSAAREGIIDGAIKTSEIGYGQRRLVKAMEDVKVMYDGTVRNAMSDVIQFANGEDGYDPTLMEWQVTKSFKLDKERFIKLYKWDDSVLEKDELLKREWTRLVKDRTMDINPNKPLPVHIERLLANTPKEYNDGEILDPQTIVKDVFKLQVELWKSLPEGSEKWDAPFAVMLRSFLSSKRLIKKYRMTKSKLDFVIKQIIRYFNRAIIAPGECVGAIAGQSLGEPATQMTLKTFHFAGMSDKNVTLGVPRFKELINAPKKVKTPSLTLHLKEGLNKSKDVAEEIMKRMICVKFGDIVNCSEVFYDPMIDGISCVKEDQELVESFLDVPDDYLTEDLQISPWVLRFEINTNILLKHRIRIIDIEEKFRQLFGMSIFMEYNDEFCSPCVVRIRPVTGKDGNDNDDVVLVQLIPYLEDIKLTGVDGITKTFAVRDPKTKEYRIETDGSNLSEVMAIPEIDFKRTFTNDPHEALTVLGVEAARQTFLKEMNTVLSFDNNYVNIHQPMQLIDVMTYNGGLMKITRHGINRRANYGPLSKCSFEETVEVLVDAARYGQVDELKGVTERIIMGMYADIGTHAFDVLLDKEILSKYADNADHSILTARVGEDAKNGFEFQSKSNTESNPYSFIPSSPSRTIVNFDYGAAEAASNGFVPSSPSRTAVNFDYGNEKNNSDTLFVPSSPSRQ